MHFCSNTVIACRKQRCCHMTSVLSQCKVIVHGGQPVRPSSVRQHPDLVIFSKGVGNSHCLTQRVFGRPQGLSPSGIVTRTRNVSIFHHQLLICFFCNVLDHDGGTLSRESACISILGVGLEARRNMSAHLLVMFVS